jgi:hypothetical protein
MKILLMLLLITSVHLAGYCQEDFLDWTPNVRIKWTDFKGKADSKSPFAAMSAVGIRYKYNSWSNGKVYKITFEIFSRFDKTRSWSKSYLQTQGMLKHEQLHFDISEIVRRDFQKEVETRTFTKDYKNEIAEIFNRHTERLQQLQQRYDEQTMHSKNKVKQKEWENLINKELGNQVYLSKK